MTCQSVILSDGVRFIRGRWDADQMWTLPAELKDEGAKDRVAPGKPRPRERACVIHVETLVHQPRVRNRGGGLELGQCLGDLVVLVRGHRPHDDRHRPYGVRPGVRTADAASRTSREEPRVGAVRQDVCARSHVSRVVGGHKAEPWQREQRRHVGVIHEEGVAKPINFVCIHVATQLRPVDDAILGNPCFHIRRNRVAARRGILNRRPSGRAVAPAPLLRERSKKGRSATQLHNGHRIGRDEESERASVVRRSKRRADHPRAQGRPANAIEQSVERSLASYVRAEERVRGPTRAGGIFSRALLFSLEHI
mmetsp:Transcript_30071/g.77937  ORF Transcript_30071/g.77937 Transcript_30071/m.77937 type:complete len:309 (+) Transcript_30071:150-1076(+)